MSLAYCSDETTPCVDNVVQPVVTAPCISRCMHVVFRPKFPVLWLRSATSPLFPAVFASRLAGKLHRPGPCTTARQMMSTLSEFTARSATGKDRALTPDRPCSSTRWQTGASEVLIYTIGGIKHDSWTRLNRIRCLRTS
jgi:hypothetical protein